MQNNGNTLSYYFSSFNKHLAQVTEFNNLTNQLLARLTLSDISFDQNLQIELPVLGYNMNLSSCNKLLAIFERLSAISKGYFNELHSYYDVLEQLIKFIKDNNKDKN